MYTASPHMVTPLIIRPLGHQIRALKAVEKAESGPYKNTVFIRLIRRHFRPFHTRHLTLSSPAPLGVRKKR